MVYEEAPLRLDLRGYCDLVVWSHENRHTLTVHRNHQ